MALDTREKRQNVAGVGRPWMRHPLPVGATDEQSRIASGLGYGGNALSLSVTVSPDYVFMFDGAFVPTAMSAETFTATEMDSETFVPTRLDTEAFDNG